LPAPSPQLERAAHAGLQCVHVVFAVRVQHAAGGCSRDVAGREHRVSRLSWCTDCVL